MCAQSQLDLYEQVRDRITVSTVHSQALKLARQVNGQADIINSDDVDKLIKRRHAGGGFLFDSGFLQAEWSAVIEPQAITTWDQYRRARRTGRGKPLTIRQRKECWTVFSGVIEDMQSRNKYTWSGICTLALNGTR